MSERETIEHLQRQLAQVRREKEQVRREKEQVRREIEQERREKEQVRREIEQELREKEQLQIHRIQHQNTTLEEYLRDCHIHAFKGLRVAEKSECSKGQATEVDGKHYPLSLRPWTDFAEVHRGHFERIRRLFGDRRLFPEPIVTRKGVRGVTRFPARCEKDIALFERIVIETPTEDIFHELFVDEQMRSEFNAVSLRFGSATGQLGLNEDEDEDDASDQEQQQPRQSRAAVEQKVRRQTRPDGLCWRKRESGHESLAFVFEYKAAHKLTVEHLEQALVKETLFCDVVHQLNSTTAKADSDSPDERVAMTLTQVFDYMIQNGVQYGYATAGKAIVFLYIDRSDVQVLYYHLCAPEEDAESTTETDGDRDSNRDSNRDSDSEGKHLDVSQTAVAKMASFCLLALRSEPLCGPGLQALQDTPILMHWPVPYQDDASRDSSGPGTAGGTKRPREPSSGSSQDGGAASYGHCAVPTRKHCTQACLLGLKRGWDLDDGCPNAAAHRAVDGGRRHPIDASEFAALVEKQVRQNAHWNCVAVDPYGLEGKIGRIGALFKIQLDPYGYTCVAKGVQGFHLHHLKHESSIYAKLDSLQGYVVPVFLGIVNLDAPKGHALPGGARVLHMMLLSWGGEVAAYVEEAKAADAAVPDVAAETKRSKEALWAEGVRHGDERVPNTLWNEERRRVMFIDFDCATLRPPAKHKQLAIVAGGGKKRNRPLGHLIRDGKRRQTAVEPERGYGHKGKSGAGPQASRTVAGAM